MKLHRMLTGVVAAVFLATLTARAQSAPAPDSGKSPTVNETYPGLANGGLSFAKLGDLPEGVLLHSGSTDITSTNLEEEIGKAPESVREGLKKNGFFVLEQMATKKLVLELAKRQAAEAKKDIASKSEQDILNDYVQGLVGQVAATDEEIAKFYEENKDACGGATFEQMKGQLKQYVLKQKQQDALTEHLRTLGQRMPITISASWTKEQAASAKDNPVDKARGSGKPTMVDFGASGCRPCDMMAPILTDLKKKYEGKASILFVHVREDQILAARYGIQSIPVQVFFDKDGKEVYRHTGFFPQADIEKKLAEFGVQ
jgi:thiol-disulfide isomerase/thioredoxin